MILAGDIGGTSTRLALFEKTEQGFLSLAEEKFSSSDYENLQDIIRQFTDKNSHEVERACFGVAGPVKGNTAKLQNLPWIVDTKEIEKLLEIDKIGLINDLEANAFGLNELGENEFEILNEGEPNETGNRAVVSAGTGLGQAGIFNKNGKFFPFATEGGHSDFAPRNELETQLLLFLKPKYGRVSIERVVSGTGLQNIYEFLRDTKRAEEPRWLAEELENAEEFGAAISKNALNGNAAICEQTLDVFVSLYGAESGNFALKVLATNGVFLGGGIAPKILPKLKENLFLESFTDKGRMRELLEKIPVSVILNDNAALLGAAHFAFYQIRPDH